MSHIQTYLRRGAMGDPCNMNLFSNPIEKERAKQLPYAEVGIKTRLFIRTQNVKKITCIFNIPCLFQNEKKLYVLNKVNKFQLGF